LTRDLVSINNTLSISHSLRLLADVPIQNAENNQSLLTMNHGGRGKSCERSPDLDSNQFWPYNVYTYLEIQDLDERTVALMHS